ARPMLYAILICTDESCAEESEAWGEPAEFDAMLCEGCGCALQALGYSEVSVATVAQLPLTAPHVRLRDAA
ncbi:MAG: hypothetical protein LC790_01910, partial [Actinobacteria bacterium]|nr:hypothetical protein [Actinomycetota bacterium]